MCRRPSQASAADGTCMPSPRPSSFNLPSISSTVASPAFRSSSTSSRDRDTSSRSDWIPASWRQLLARNDIIEALVDVATGLAPAGEWLKVEVIKKFLLQEHPGLEANAPRYAKFYRMLEDTGRFDVQLQGSTVMARLKE